MTTDAELTRPKFTEREIEHCPRCGYKQIAKDAVREAANKMVKYHGWEAGKPDVDKFWAAFDELQTALRRHP